MLSRDYDWPSFLANSLRDGDWPRLLSVADVGRLVRLPRPVAWVYCLYLRRIGLGWGGKIDSRAYEGWLRRRAHDLWRYPPYGWKL